MPPIEYRDQKQPVTIKPLEGIVEGYPIVFNARTNIGNWFFEEIDPHALDEADLSDIKFLVNHDNRMIPIARHRRGKRSTMEVNIDINGMPITATLDIENNVNSKMLCSAVERGDLEDMSFAFGIEVAGDEWSDLDKDMPVRRITKISKVYEISAVNDGAYPQTSISARSASLDNAKTMLDNIRAQTLDNEKPNDIDLINLEKEKFIFLNGGK